MISLSVRKFFPIFFSKFFVLFLMLGFGSNVSLAQNSRGLDSLRSRMTRNGHIVTFSNAPDNSTVQSSFSSYDLIVIAHSGYGQWDKLNNTNFNTSLRNFVSNGGGLILNGWIGYTLGGN